MSLYRHKTIRNYTVGEHEFKDHLYRPQDEAENARFQEIFAKLPERERVQIVELDEDAIANLERPVGSRVVTGPQGSDQIDSTKTQTGGALDKPFIGGVSGFAGLGADAGKPAGK